VHRLIGAFRALLTAAAGAWLGGCGPSSPTAPRDRVLIVHASVRDELIAPVLRAFAAENPHIRIRHESMDGLQLYRSITESAAKGSPAPDLIISVAMDLQVKLVNDGYTSRHSSKAAAALPSWAKWRNEAFAVTFEPVAMVFNLNVMGARPIPRTRAELYQAINREPDFWRGRVGAHDIRESGLGYLLTSQDMRQASDFAALLQAFGDAQVRLLAGEGLILREVESGKLAVGYNILAGRGEERRAGGAPIAIVYPRDYTLAVLRTALIPRNAANPRDARILLDFLLSENGQRILSDASGYDPIREDLARAQGPPYAGANLRPIPLKPGLLVYLDPHKRRRLIANWLTLVERGSAAATAASPENEAWLPGSWPIGSAAERPGPPIATRPPR
jgi:iron(III) transport system substrate-binding protein